MILVCIFRHMTYYGFAGALNMGIYCPNLRAMFARYSKLYSFILAYSDLRFSPRALAVS